MKPRIMYIEGVGEGLMIGPNHIGRCTFSNTGRTVYYKGREFHRLGAYRCGYKCNHYDKATGAEYWISAPKKNGQDTLYPGIVEIDADVQEEYWTQIRQMPEMVGTTQFRSEGKYSKRQPK